MIAANELRIGNWVEDEDVSRERFQVKVIAEGIDYTKGMYFINGRWSEDLNPIPLTPEILESTRFVKHRTSNQFWSHFILETGWYISQRVAAEPMAGFEEKDKFYWGESYIKIEHVHQLQNLYFALTGQELEINL